MTLKPMEGVKAYRLPTINPGYSNYGQACPSGHLRPLGSKVSSCVIDTPRDNEQGYRENLWSFQKHHRGVRHPDDQAPDIPFRLRSNEFTSDEQGMDSSFGFPCLDSYGSSLVSDGSILRQLSRTRTTFASTDPIPRVKDKDSPFIAKGVTIPFTKSLKLVSRDRRSPKAPPARNNGGSFTERLPRMSGSKPEVNDAPSLKKSSSLIDVREDSYERSSTNSDCVSSVSIDINSDKVGHTTNAVIDTTLADILNRHNSGKYYDLGNKASGLSNSNEGQLTKPNNDRQWSHKFETKIVDGGLYDNFARTRKPDIEKEKKCESKNVKRQKIPDQDATKTVTSSEGSARKLSTGQVKKHSKLKLSLSNSKTSD